MTREEAWRKTKGYLYNVLDAEEAGEIIKALEQEPCDDAINRSEIIYELNRLGRNAFKDDTDYDNFFAFLDNMPPVTP